MFYLDPVKGITEAFNDFVINGNLPESDGDIELSPDWQTITLYRANGYDAETIWSSNRCCLKDLEYEECRSGRPGPPPKTTAN